MRERIVFAFDPFVIPFTLGMVFIILYLSVGGFKIIAKLSAEEKMKLLKHTFSFAIFKTLWDIIADCLLHIKIFKRNIRLGYMHASIAFGWFMLIFIGHIEVMLYTPQRVGVLYYPVFFRYFVMKTHETLRGDFFFFLMDLFLLIVLSGVGIAIYKRFRSAVVGMKRTTKLRTGDKIALYSLWLIFPLRLFAESFTAGISGGSFLTITINRVFNTFATNESLIQPVWWAYSLTLGAFLFALPFSRYMHIPTEIFLIWMRNSGIRATSSRDGYAESEIYSCSSCGICIDACPMTVKSENSKLTSVYYLRLMRRRLPESMNHADKCLMCGRCVEMCPVEIDSCKLKVLKREEEISEKRLRMTYLSEVQVNINKSDVLYYAGCMTHLTPVIYNSLFKILQKSGTQFSFMDKDGSICCGRPLMLSGDTYSAKELIEKNRQTIIDSGAKTLLLSCPICYKVFKEEYDLPGVEVVHHTEYINRLLNEGKIAINKSGKSFVFHDPCDLGRGSGIFEQPREILMKAGELRFASEERGKSHCCGGSLGSLSLDKEERNGITKAALDTLFENNPDELVTACPLCYKSFKNINGKPTADIAQIVAEQMV